MYVESLSSYARQFLGRMEKPEVDYIKGVSPAIAIEQKVNTRNPRSTVGTSTEIYDYLKLLFARIGKTYSPVSGKEVKRDTVTDVVNTINKLPEGTRVMVAAPLRIKKGRKVQEELALLLSKGFARILVDGEMKFIEDVVGVQEEGAKKKKAVKIDGTIEVLIDRTSVNANDEDTVFRLSDSVQTAFFEGEGDCIVYAEGHPNLTFSDRFELD